MKKRIAALILAVITVFSLVAMTACNSSTDTEKKTTESTTVKDAGYKEKEKYAMCFDNDMKPYAYAIGKKGSEIKYGVAGFSVDVLSRVSTIIKRTGSLGQVETENVKTVFKDKSCDVCVMSAESAKDAAFKNMYVYTDKNYPEVSYVFESEKVFNDFKRTYASLEKDGTISTYAKAANIKSK